VRNGLKYRKEPKPCCSLEVFDFSAHFMSVCCVDAGFKY